MWRAERGNDFWSLKAIPICVLVRAIVNGTQTADLHATMLHSLVLNQETLTLVPVAATNV